MRKHLLFHVVPDNFVTLCLWTRLPLSSSILVYNFQKTTVCVWRHTTQYCLIHFYLINIQCRKLWFFFFCYMFVYIISFCGYQNVDIWYIGFLFFTYVVFFLHRQNIYIMGWGRELSWWAQKSVCMYLSIGDI